MAAAKQDEEEEESPPELGNLSADAVRYIFSLIPLKPLIKSKRVSRTWRNFITDFRRRHPPTTATGLAVMLKRITPEAAGELKPFLQETVLLPPPNKRRRRDFRHNVPLYLQCSCEGLLLYAGGGIGDGVCRSYYLRDGIHDRCISLPPADEGTRQVQIGLTFNGAVFCVVFMFLQEVDFEKEVINCKIFSSKRWEWREIAARIQNICLMDVIQGFNQADSTSSSLCFNGRIYWIWSICMLEFHTGDETFKLFSLPLKPEKLFSSLLYESDGQIYFCSRYTDGTLHIFKFNDRAHDVYKWKLSRSVRVQECILQKQDWSRFWRRIRPCAFNEDLQELILVVPPLLIVSYSLETGEFRPVWSCGEMKDHTTCIFKVLPLLFKSVHNLGKCSCTASSKISCLTTGLFSES